MKGIITRAAVRWLVGIMALSTAFLAVPAQAGDTIKVGILHSLSGTMAISETTLKDTMLMLIDEQNKKGGLLGKKLEPVRYLPKHIITQADVDQFMPAQW